MANALKVINARVKKLAKKFPKKKRATLQKQAGREWKTGKLKTRKTPAKKTARKKKPVPRRKAAPRKKATRKRVAGAVGRAVGAKVSRKKPAKKKRKVVTKSTYTRSRSVGGISPKMEALLLAGGLAAVVYFATRPKGNGQVIIPTGNVTRDSQASQILAYASAAGLAATQIAKLIASLNQSDDAAIKNVYDNVQNNGGIPAGYLA